MITILLSTFNGEKFLSEQLASLAAQDFKDWKLIARDDGSSDRTRSLLNSFAANEHRIQVLESDGERLGPARSFGHLANMASESDYIMFCDQDDVWQPQKISRSLERMQNIESQYGADAPILVFGDLEVVNENLETQAPSMHRLFGYQIQRQKHLFPLLAQNIVTGCTTLVNRSLVKRALPLPPEALMHDWWFGLVAASLGHLVYLDEAFVKYRQHGANASGGSRMKGFGDVVRMLRLDRQSFERLILQRVSQSRALLKHLKHQQAPTDLLDRLENYHNELQASPLRALLAAHRNDALPEGALRRIFYDLTLLAYWKKLG